MKKNQEVFFFAWLDNKGTIKNQRGYKSKGQIWKSRRDADWFCISSHHSAWFKDPEGCRTFGKTKENIHTIYFNFLDLDCDDLILTTDIIIQRCNAYNLPYPTYIIETSPNHFHILWQLKKPLILNNKKLLRYWESIQARLYQTFKDLGADPNALDSNRYLRNPYNDDQVNTKYPEKPKIQIFKYNNYSTLGEFNEAFINAGIQNPRSGGERRSQTSFEISKKKLLHFFKENKKFQGTYRDISELLEIPESTLYLIVKWIVKKGLLKRFRERIGNTWNTIFHYLGVDTTRHSNSLNTFNKQNNNPLKTLSVFVAEKGIPEGFRNEGYFLITVFLKNYYKWDQKKIFSFFSKGPLLNIFKNKELKKIIKSVFKHDYKFIPGSANYRTRELQKIYNGAAL